METPKGLFPRRRNLGKFSEKNKKVKISEEAKGKAGMMGSKDLTGHPVTRHARLGSSSVCPHLQPDDVLPLAELVV